MNEWKPRKEPEQKEPGVIGAIVKPAAVEAPATQPGATPSEPTNTNGEIPYATSPTWTAPYEKERRSAARRIESQQPFTYDPASDPTYQQYEDAYTRMGEKTRDDTIGVLRARGGGQVSSYAAIAAQQANEAYMQELADKVPELRQLAYQMWLGEGDRARSDLQMYDALNSSDAARWGATVLDPYLQDRSYAFEQRRYQDSLENLRWNREYQVGQDKLAQERQAKQDAMAEADWYKENGDLSKLQEMDVDTTRLEKAMGASEEDLSALEQIMVQAAQGGESIQGLMNVVWRSGYYSDEDKERLKAYAQSLGYTVTEG